MDEEYLQPNFNKWRIRYEDIVHNGVISYNSAFSMPSLEYISSVHLVASLWRKQLKNFKQPLKWCHVCKIGNKIKRELNGIVGAKQLLDHFPHLIILVGQELNNWIDFYDYYVFKKLRKRRSVAIGYIDRIVWSPRGTIHHLKTAKSMLKVKKSYLYKGCRILCEDCEKSEDVLIGFPAFVWEERAMHLDDEHNPMKYFWENFMHRSNEDWDRLLNQGCLYCFEREASKYLRNTPGDEYNIHVIFNLQYEFYIDYSCYIVSKLNKDKQGELMDFGVFCDDIIPQFLMEPLYLDYFLPSLYHIRHEIPEENVCQILFDLNNLIGDHYSDATKGYSYLYEKYVFFFEEIWLFLPDDIKDFVLDLEITAFDWLWQYDSMHLIPRYFSNCRPSVKSILLTSTRALWFCEELLKNNEWELFQQYVCPVFFDSSVEELVTLKGEFVKEMKNVFWHFIKNKRWSDVDRLFEWSHENPNVRFERKKLLLGQVLFYEVAEKRFAGGIHYKTRYQCNTRPTDRITDFSHFDELLDWCFDSKKEITKFKRTELCYNETFAEIISDLLKRNRTDIIGEFLSWCFSDNKRLIIQFKKKFGNGLEYLEDNFTKEPSPKRRRTR